MSIKIATFADFHLGVTTYGSTDPKTALNTRVLNALESLDAMIDYVIENKIKYIVMPGDAYKNNLPSPTIQDEFDKRIKRAADNGIICYLQSGNHDVSPIKTAKSPLETYKTLKIDNVFHTRYKKVYMLEDKLKLLVLPTYCNQEQVEEILNEENDGIPTLVVGHCTLLGAKLNDWLIEKNEDAIEIDTFKKSNILGVVLGHLHKYQILNKSPLIYYTGSLQRIDFTEENQEKGFVVLDIDVDNLSIKHEFIEIESQKFCTIKLDLTEVEDEMECIKDEMHIKSKLLENSIARLILDVNKNNKIEDNILIKQLREHGVLSVASIQKNFDRNEIVRNKDLTEEITEEQALKMFFKDYKNSDKIIEVGLDMIKQLRNNNLI
jgi:exonuclease SbcD